MSKIEHKISNLVAQYFNPLIYQSGDTASGDLSPGGICGVFYGGKTYYFPLGIINNSNEAPTEKTVFGIGSVTKVFTTSILGQQDTSLFDKSVSNYLPSGFSLTPQEEPVTFSELATFTGGVNPTIPPQGNSTTQAQFESFINALNPDELPSRNQYSNSSIGFLAQILMGMDGFSSASESDTQQWLEQNLFDALSMNHTGAPSKNDANHPLSDAYAYNPSTGQYETISYDGWCPWGAAGRTFSTCKDMIRFVQANVGISTIHGKTVSSIILNGMIQAHIPRTANQAFAWVEQNSNSQNPVLIKNGGVSGVSSVVTICPSLQIGVVFLRNIHQRPAPNQEALNIMNGLIAL